MHTSDCHLIELVSVLLNGELHVVIKVGNNISPQFRFLCRVVKSARGANEERVWLI